jgi:seryl-tRNA synthetase
LLDIKFVRDHLEVVESATAARGNPFDWARFREIEKLRRELIFEVEQKKAARNQASDEIARARKAGEDASELMAQTRALGDEIKRSDARLEEVDAEVRELLLSIPNIPDASVPVGADETANVEIRRWGTPPVFDFQPRPHWEIGESMKILDFERAVKLAKSRFALYRGAGAKLERALISFMLDLHGAKGYTEWLPPILANSATLTGTGNLPKFADELFKCEMDDLYLIPTAEVVLTNLHRDEVLDAADMPKHYCAFTPCFRREAGAAGRDTRGLIRLHQFNKVELVKFTTPETSMDELETLLADASAVLEALGLAYRVVVLSTGDMSFASAKTYDIEVWMPSYDGYKEISSCSNCTDFQARRANVRYKPAPGEKSRFAHTLNGSGLAIGRTTAAVLENCQRADGSVAVPEVLRQYLGGASEIDAGGELVK